MLPLGPPSSIVADRRFRAMLFRQFFRVRCKLVEGDWLSSAPWNAPPMARRAGSEPLCDRSRL